MSSSSWSQRTSLRTRTKDSVLSVSFSTDDNLLAIGHFCGTINIFDVHTFAKIHELNVTNINTKDNQSNLITSHKNRSNEENDGVDNSANTTNNQLPSGHDENREKLPVTALAFRPSPYSSQLNTSKSATATLSSALSSTLLACCSNGQWVMLDASNGDIIRQDKEEKENEIYCCDWNCNGTVFATAGRDSYVRIYEQDSGLCVKRFTVQSPGSGVAPLRIYSLAFHPSDPHLVYAGGWSQTVTVFDIRSTRDGYVEPSRRSDLFGPLLMGDALCLVPRNEKITVQAKADEQEKSKQATTSFMTATGDDGNDNDEDGDPNAPTHTTGYELFTASHRLENRLELFDSASMTKIADIPWPAPQQQFLPLCCASSPDGTFLAFGGGGSMDDGAFIISTPSAAKRAQAAKAAAAHKKMQRHATTSAVEDDTTTTTTTASENFLINFDDDDDDSTSKKVFCSLEHRQPEGGRHPIVAMRFSNSGRVLAMCDSDGVTHIFEAPANSNNKKLKK